MNIPPEAAYYEDLHLLIWRPHGVPNEESIKRFVDFVEWQEAQVPDSFSRFTDTTRLDEIDLNFHFALNVSLCRQLTFAARPNLKSAFLVGIKESGHYVKLHALLTDHSPLQVKIFHECAAAAFWLNVPVTVLRC